MFSEAIALLSPRDHDSLDRLSAAAAPNLGTEQLVEKYERVVRAEGGREEDSRPDHRESERPTGRPAPVTYPPAGPSLPPPLVPIREVPLPDAALRPDGIPEAIQDQLGLDEESPEALVRLESKREEHQIGREQLASGDGAEPTPGSANAPSKGMQRAFAVEQTLQRIVLSQAPQTQRAPVGHEDAGRFFHETV